MLNKMLITFMPLVPKPIIHLVAKKYIAGDLLEDAVRVSQELKTNEGAMTTIDVLGEFVNDRDRAIVEKSDSSKVIDAISNHNLETYLSIKPTSIGLALDEEFAYSNLKELVEKAKRLGIFVRIDMENSPYTDKTLRLYKRLRDSGFDNVGFVIQSYMRRSIEDVKSFIEYKPNIRLCKGIYRESQEIAYQDKQEVRENYKKLFDLMVDNGVYVGIATHDDELIDYAKEQINKKNLDKLSYEFQMLLGVKEQTRRSILNEGHRLRVYVPFGMDWYGYSTRRLKENPNMAGQIFKSLFTRN